MVRDRACSAVARVRCQSAAAAAARVIANVPQLYSELHNRADKLGFDLSAGDLFLTPDDPLFVRWITEFREQREALQRKFDPLHGGKAPPRPSAQLRKALEVLAVAAA